jgi:YD repeat-containing protein
VTLGYDDLNRRTSLTLSNGVVTEYGYDDASELTSLTYRLGVNVLGSLTYSYDASGNRTAVGGSWARAILPQPIASGIYDAANQMTQFGASNYTYDLNGSLASDGLNSFSWNPRNQLNAIVGPAAAAFQYDPTGLRTMKTLAGVSTTTLNDGRDAVQDLVGTSTLSRLAGERVDERWGISNGTSTVYPLVDALGSTVAFTDPTGNIGLDPIR